MVQPRTVLERPPIGRRKVSTRRSRRFPTVATAPHRRFSNTPTHQTWRAVAAVVCIGLQNHAASGRAALREAPYSDGRRCLLRRFLLDTTPIQQASPGEAVVETVGRRSILFRPWPTERLAEPKSSGRHRRGSNEQAHYPLVVRSQAPWLLGQVRHRRSVPGIRPLASSETG